MRLSHNGYNPSDKRRRRYGNVDDTGNKDLVNVRCTFSTAVRHACEYCEANSRLDSIMGLKTCLKMAIKHDLLWKDQRINDPGTCAHNAFCVISHLRTCESVRSFSTHSGVRQSMTFFILIQLNDRRGNEKNTERFQNLGIQITSEEKLVDLEPAGFFTPLFDENKAQVFLDEQIKLIPFFGMHFAPTKFKVMLVDMRSLNTPITIRGEELLFECCISKVTIIRRPSQRTKCMNEQHSEFAYLRTGAWGEYADNNATRAHYWCSNLMDPAMALRYTYPGSDHKSPTLDATDAVTHDLRARGVVEIFRFDS
ncbi:hypothetical protein CLF_102133 [Clonorchis sinensis]|uniref:Uncharacterized protein n=1 Tax=Clonorchis sinensis TaxID=79923 RepID=G7YMY0_CLOSI|nr:hypothetical protein CLF_102133 [Clonorchis sinensis]